jgi:methylglutaconyl-CoA hydratase
MSDENPVLLDVTPGELAVVTINRPEKKNAFDRETINQLADTFDLLAKNTDEVRIVMLRGAGDTFCAGGDLNWMKNAAGYTREQNIEDAEALAGMLYKLFHLPQLTIALVSGAAMGGGSGLVAACDVAIAVKNTKFSFSEVKLGLTPATISPFVIRAIGPRWAKALFATAERFDAQFAHLIGLVQYVVSDAEELDEMGEYVAKLGFGAAPGAIADSKKLVDDVFEHDINHSLMGDLAKRIANRRASEEGQEGLSAFLEKRKPGWVG